MWQEGVEVGVDSPRRRVYDSRQAASVSFSCLQHTRLFVLFICILLHAQLSVCNSISKHGDLGGEERQEQEAGAFLTTPHHTRVDSTSLQGP